MSYSFVGISKMSPLLDVNLVNITCNSSRGIPGKNFNGFNEKTLGLIVVSVWCMIVVKQAGLFSAYVDQGPLCGSVLVKHKRRVYVV